MSDITFALEAKSDQLNAVDLMAGDRVIRIRHVDVNKVRSQQKVWVYFDGDGDKPWKPSKGMLRALASAWGTDSDKWVGRMAKLYRNPDVLFKGEKVGGIWIRALSDIPVEGLHFTMQISRGKRQLVSIELLQYAPFPYPDDLFKRALPTMIRKMNSGEMSLQQVIGQCQQTGELSEMQRKILEDAAPVELGVDNVEGEG